MKLIAVWVVSELINLFAKVNTSIAIGKSTVTNVAEEVEEIKSCLYST